MHTERTTPAGVGDMICASFLCAAPDAALRVRSSRACRGCRGGRAGRPDPEPALGAGGLSNYVRVLAVLSDLRYRGISMLTMGPVRPTGH